MFRSSAVTTLKRSIYHALLLTVASLMASLSDICNELTEIHPALHNDAYTADVKQKMVNTVCAKIENLTGVGAAGGQTLMTTVQSMGLAEPHGVMLKGAINRMLMAPSHGRGAKSNAEGQLLVNILSFLTAKDWIRLEEPNSVPEVHLYVLADRVSSLGLRNFDERTYRWLLTIVLARYLAQHGSWPKYQAIYNWLQVFKTNYVRKPWNFDVITTYPPHPHMLPADILAAAYPDATDPPIDKAIDNFAQLSTHIVLRKNNRLLVNEIEAEK